MFAGGGIPYGLMRGMAGGGRRRGGADPWFLMLAYQLWQQIERLGPNKPKLTLGLMALCAAMHFGVLGALSPLALLGVHSATRPCLSPRKVSAVFATPGRSRRASARPTGVLLR